MGIFSGKIVETDKENVFVISLVKSSFNNPDNGQNIKLLQIGELVINSENSIGNNQECRNSIRRNNHRFFLLLTKNHSQGQL